MSAAGAFSHVVVTFRGRCKGSVVQSRLFVTGATDQSGFASKCRFRGRCSTLDMVVIFGARSDLVTGAVNRDFLTCGSFADFVAAQQLCEPRGVDFVA